MYMNIHLCTVADHHTVRLYIPMHSRKNPPKLIKRKSRFHLFPPPFSICRVTYNTDYSERRITFLLLFKHICTIPEHDISQFPIQ